MKVQKSQSGMSLVEVMVAVSILSVIMVGVMTMGRNMDKTAKNAEKRGDIEGMMAQITQAMVNKESCTATVMNAAGGVNSTTMLTGIKMFDSNGNLEANPRLRVSSIAAGDTRNSVVINGMYITNRANHGIGANYDLVVTFVKNPKAAGGGAVSAGNTMVNYVTRKIPLDLDNCTRTLRWAVVPTIPSCVGSETAVSSTPVVVTSSSASHPNERFNIITCRDCNTRTTVRGCN